MSLIPGNFDAIVVGGRIAGCATAIHLSKLGKRVLVVERAQFPHSTISTHLMKPDSVVMLTKLGLASELAMTDAPSLKWFRQDFDGFVIEGRLPSLAGCDYGYCIKRDILDNILVKFAQKQPGVMFLEKFSVTELLWENRRVVGIRGWHGGCQKDIRGSIVIGADGRYSVVAKTVKAYTYFRKPIGRAAYYGYFRNVEPTQYPSIEIFVRNKNWFYLFPTNGDSYLVAIGIDSQRVPEFNRNRYAAFMQVLQECPQILRRLSSAELVEGIYLAHSSQAAGYLRRTGGPGWALVGDSGMYFDPLLGQGMGTALRSAEILADELAGHENWQALQRLDRYELRRNWEFGDLYAYTCSVSSARGFSSLERWFYKKVSVHPRLCQKYLGVASHTNRVLGFLAACFLHPEAFLTSPHADVTTEYNSAHEND